VPVVVYTGALEESLTMKVTQLQEGFRIDVSDDEMRWLRRIVRYGVPLTLREADDEEDDLLNWEPHELALFARRMMEIGSRDLADILMVDEDRRAA
jgi:hypothetical protein